MKNQFLSRRFYIRISIFAACVIIALSGCKTSNYNYYKGFNKSPVVVPKVAKGKFSPVGMVYIPAGTLDFKSPTSVEIKKVTVSSFYIDEAEVSNRQYRIFTTWVADSIAVTDFLKDDKYFEKSKQKSKNRSLKDTLRRINWVAVRKHSPLWKSKDPAIAAKLEPMIKPEGEGIALNKELIMYRYTRIKTSGPKGNTFETIKVPVFPTENVWSMDFPNSQVEIMDWNYLDDKTYNDHPVVGVNWKQANAFADWRGRVIPLVFKSNPYLPKTKIAVSLPTEAQWQLAASGKKADSAANGLYKITNKKKRKSELTVNFKQGEGEYSLDGGTFTLPVRSYFKNSYGLYNAEGNVSEWTLDAYSPSSLELTSDLNPVLKYNALDDESSFMKRKVVRGGSWKDNATDVGTATRGYDDQDASHSYIGFRCVTAAYELPSDQVRSRTLPKKSSKKK
jgi:sulfatase modifying factor 1